MSDKTNEISDAPFPNKIDLFRGLLKFIFQNELLMVAIVFIETPDSREATPLNSGAFSM